MFEKRLFRVQVNRLSLLSSSDLQLGAARGYAPVEYIFAHLAILCLGVLGHGWDLDGILWLGALGYGWDLDVRKTPFQSAGEPFILAVVHKSTTWRDLRLRPSRVYFCAFGDTLVGRIGARVGLRCSKNAFSECR